MKTFCIWALVLALAGSAFFAGKQLRARQESYVSSGDVSIQANMLLKLTPERSPVSVDKVDISTTADRNLVSSVLKLLKANYVEPITPERETQMARGAVRSMLASLNDPDSHFVDPKERKLLDDAASGTFHGIGAIFALRNTKEGTLDTTGIVVVSPMPGSPADQAGLKPGDSITDIGNKWIITHDPFQETELKKLERDYRNKAVDFISYQKAFQAAEKKLKSGITIADALETLTAKSSGEVKIRVDRPGHGKALDLSLRCSKTTVDPVTARMLKRKIAYISISQFSKRAMREFATELQRMKAQKARALILDLRNNPGGTMDVAVDIAGKLTGGGVMATIIGKSGRHQVKAPLASPLNIPVAVLINGGTASVAELTAGTLRDSASAIIVGTGTFGDGLVQTPLVLRDGSAAVLTTGKMVTAKGYDFNAKGIQPDMVVKDDRRNGDVQLDQAEKALAVKL